MPEKALIITGRLVQDHEYIYPYYRLQEEEYEVDVAVRGGETVLASYGIRIEPTKDIPELNVEDYSVLVLPGGAKSMEYMRQDQEILDFISAFHASGKVIGSICHAGQLLEVWGPLGNGFTPRETEHLVMVAGGIGLVGARQQGLDVAGQRAVDRRLKRQGPAIVCRRAGCCCGHAQQRQQQGATGSGGVHQTGS